ncbi:hypothetical protein V5O48_011221, partial [Marasmius crinis-equi]
MAESKHSSVAPTDDENKSDTPASPPTRLRRKRSEGVDLQNQLTSKRNTKPTEKVAGQAGGRSGKRKASDTSEGSGKQKKKKPRVEDSATGAEDTPIVVDDANDNGDDETEPHDNVPQTTAKKQNLSAIKGAFAKEEYFKATFYPGKTDQEILAAQIKEWKGSDKTTTYQHFNLSKVEITYPKKAGTGPVKYKFYCISHPSQFVGRARYETSTGNLGRHVKSCSSKVAEPAQRIEQYAVASAYDRGKLRLKAVYWAIEDPRLREMFQVANGAVQLSYPGRLDYSFNGWTAANTDSYLSLIVHKLNGIEMESFMLDFIHLKKCHTGTHLGEEFLACLAKFGVTLKAVTSIFKPRKKVADDNNDDKEDGEGEEHKDSDDKQEEEDDELPANEEEAEGFIEQGEHVSSRSENPGREAEDEQALEDAKGEMEAILNDRNARKMVKTVHYSNQLKTKLKDICKHRGLMLHTLWIMEYTSSGQPKKVTSKGKNPLQSLKLSDNKWQLFESLLPLLQQYRDATLELETNKRPLLFEVIRYMDAINNILEDFINNMGNATILCWGVALGLTVLDKYYAKTDETMLYQGAMIMHPRYKLSYFRKEKWPQDWIDAVVKSVKALWTDYYKPQDEADGQQKSVINTAHKSRFLQDDDI